MDLFLRGRKCKDKCLSLAEKGFTFSRNEQFGIACSPGSTITTESCIKFLENWFLWFSLKDQFWKRSFLLGEKTNKFLIEYNPDLLLVSVVVQKFPCQEWWIPFFESWASMINGHKILAEQTNPDFAHTLLPTSSSNVCRRCIWNSQRTFLIPIRKLERIKTNALKNCQLLSTKTYVK